jgi:Zn-dependent protease with chaperone function
MANSGKIINFKDNSLFEQKKIIKKFSTTGEELLTDRTRHELFELSRKYGIELPKILITVSRAPQAYAWPSIKVTRGLLDILSDKELFATLLHEIGHKKIKWRYLDYILIPAYLLSLLYLTVLVLGNFVILNGSL